MTINWPELVFSERFFQRVETLARSSIPDEATVEEAVTYTISSLSDDDWKRCKSFKGGSAPETFLYTLSTNLILDYARKVYGRQRPPVWLKRKGILWMALWKSLCQDRQAPESVVDRHLALVDGDRHIVLDAIREIRTRLPWCGVSNRVDSMDDSESVVRLVEAASVDEPVMEDDMLYFAHELLKQEDDSVDADKLSISDPQRVVDAVTGLELSQEEALVLRMHFCDGLSFSAIARALGLPKQAPVRLTQKALERARQQLTRRGIEPNLVGA
ncbi:hypothetical protein [Allohahella marinimesophila]|uniref:RNA polymerase sigma factor (Sigma-70 family) n=1 Tax=Allohahella marinimesophila TaxID=1054972 RepID=A0ABP7NKV7_9GAMM